MVKNLGNLTLIMNQSQCDKKCPFCIAKASGKIYNQANVHDDEFRDLDKYGSIRMTMWKLPISIKQKH